MELISAIRDFQKNLIPYWRNHIEIDGGFAAGIGGRFCIGTDGRFQLERLADLGRNIQYQ